MSEYSSERADMLEEFVKHRMAANRWNPVSAKNLMYFDRYCSRGFPGIQGINQHMVDGWCKQRETENKQSRMRYLDITTEQEVAALSTLEEERHKNVRPKWNPRKDSLAAICNLRMLKK